MQRGGIFWLLNSQDIQYSSAKRYVSARKIIFMLFYTFLKHCQGHSQRLDSKWQEFDINSYNTAYIPKSKES